MVIELTDKSLNKQIENGLVLVNFGDDECVGCKILDPLFKKVSKSYNDITFAHFNVGKYPDKKKDFLIKIRPCVILFKNGKEVDRFTGAPILEEWVKRSIDELLAKI